MTAVSRKLSRRLSRTLATQAAAVLGVALVTLGLYVWSSAAAWSLRADRVQMAAWCVRLAAVAAAAAGQLPFALVVVPGVFGGAGRPRDRHENVYAVVCAVVTALCLVAAAVLAALARW